MDSLSFEPCNAQLSFAFTYGNKNQKQLTDTPTVYIVSSSKTKQNKTGMMKNVAKLA